MKLNINQIVIATIIATFFASCSSPKSIYMGSNYGSSQYIWDKNEWPREDKNVTIGIPAMVKIGISPKIKRQGNDV